MANQIGANLQLFVHDCPEGCPVHFDGIVAAS